MRPDFFAEPPSDDQLFARMVAATPLSSLLQRRADNDPELRRRLVQQLLALAHELVGRQRRRGRAANSDGSRPSSAASSRSTSSFVSAR